MIVGASKNVRVYIGDKNGDTLKIEKEMGFDEVTNKNWPTITLTSDSDYILYIKDGEKEKTVFSQKDGQGAILFLDFLFGVVPMLIDISTGAWYLHHNIRL